jgi:hypothetical protein
MLSPRRHNYYISGLDFLVLAVDGCKTAARREQQDLVDGVNLRSVSFSIER